MPESIAIFPGALIMRWLDDDDDACGFHVIVAADTLYQPSRCTSLADDARIDIVIYYSLGTFTTVNIAAIEIATYGERQFVVWDPHDK